MELRRFVFQTSLAISQPQGPRGEQRHPIVLHVNLATGINEGQPICLVLSAGSFPGRCRGGDSQRLEPLWPCRRVNCHAVDVSVASRLSVGDLYISRAGQWSSCTFLPSRRNPPLWSNSRVPGSFSSALPVRFAHRRCHNMPSRIAMGCMSMIQGMSGGERSEKPPQAAKRGCVAPGNTSVYPMAQGIGYQLLGITSLSLIGKGRKGRGIRAKVGERGKKERKSEREGLVRSLL